MIRRYLSYAAGEALSKVLPKPTAFRFARRAASVYAVFSRDLPAVRHNLSAALPDVSHADLTRLSRELLDNYSAYLVELFYADRLDRAAVERSFEMLGREHLDRALAAGKGLILVSAHVGNWELGAIALARLGYPMHVIALTHTNPKIDRFFTHLRRRHGLETLPVGCFMRKAYEVPRRNRILAMNADRYFGGEAVASSFLGRGVRFSSGFARAALSAGAPVIPAFCLPAGGKHRLEIGPPLESGDSEEALVDAYARRAEAVIRRHPTQWFVFQRFDRVQLWPA